MQALLSSCYDVFMLRALKKADFPSLPKWPAMVVVGDPVEPDEAAIINVRTSSMEWSSNDHDFKRELNELLGLSSVDPWEFDDVQQRFAAYDAFKAVEARYGVLDLQYLRNQNVVSSWIGGPHGWCSWSGYICTTSYNIGKWPSVDDVAREWRLIARAFPKLKLKCQLYSGETCEEQIVPLVEFSVSKGRVTVLRPKKELIDANFVRDTSDRSMRSSLGLLGQLHHERGCTIDQYARALELTRARLAEEQRSKKLG